MANPALRCVCPLMSGKSRRGLANAQCTLGSPYALPKVTSLFVLHVSVGSRLGMAKDIRRFGAKGPAMGMPRLARDAGIYGGIMTTLCAAGKVTFTQVHNARKFPRHPPLGYAWHPLRHFLANAM